PARGGVPHGAGAARDGRSRPPPPTEAAASHRVISEIAAAAAWPTADAKQELATATGEHLPKSRNRYAPAQARPPYPKPPRPAGPGAGGAGSAGTWASRWAPSWGSCSWS